jgi:prophage regulatory protein|tara:strand:- start:361 stop:558 length:198 start_codon:yes stop_codon:yes gene_type:complete
MQLHHQLLRRTQVQELTGLSKTSIYKRMNEGNFPQSIALSPKTIRWVRGEVIKWIEEQILIARTS